MPIVPKAHVYLNKFYLLSKIHEGLERIHTNDLHFNKLLSNILITREMFRGEIIPIVKNVKGRTVDNTEILGQI